MKVPYTTEPECKQPTVLNLIIDLALAAIGASAIVMGSLYALGVLQ